MKNVSFSCALACLKEGKKIKRAGWNSKTQYIILAHMQTCVTATGISINDPEHENIGSKFLLFVGSSGYQCGWLASQADILAEDWEVFE